MANSDPYASSYADETPTRTAEVLKDIPKPKWLTSDYEMPCFLPACLKAPDFANLRRVLQINSLETFRANKEAFEQFFKKLSGLDRDCTAYARAHIIRVRNLLHNEMANSEPVTCKSFMAALEAHDEVEALRCAQRMIDKYEEPEEVRWVEDFLNMFPIKIKEFRSNINSAKVGRAMMGHECPAETVELGKCSVGEFVCPILYSEETDPIILVADPRHPVLSGFTKEDTRELIDCPLSAMIHSRFLKNFVGAIDHPISLTAYREAIECGRRITVSPMTRRRILGALTLGAHQSHVEATNWTLSQLMSGGKKLGNPDMWFACLWLLVEDGKLPFLKEVLPHIREHMLFRLRTSLAPASLTGLPGYVNYKIPLGCACWFSLCSCLCKGVSVHQDTIRIHMRHTRPLFRLCELAGYEVPESIQLYNKRLRVLITLRLQALRNFPRYEALIQGLTQKVLFLRDVGQDVQTREYRYSDVIPLDGAAGAEQIDKILSMLPKYCRDISVQDVAEIGRMITHPSIPLSAIDLSVRWTPQPRPVVCEWAHYDANFEKLPYYDICPATLHPYYYAQQSTRMTWKHSLEAAIGQGKIFSECHYWGFFLSKYMRQPLPQDLVAFMYCRMVVRAHGKMVTLPQCCLLLAQRCCERFAMACGDRSTESLKKVFVKSQPLSVRLHLEKKYLKKPDEHEEDC